MSTANVVTASIEQAVGFLQSIADFRAAEDDPTEARVYRVNNMEDLMDEVEGIPRPCVGVVYEGMRNSDPSKQQGYSAEVVISFVLFMDTEKLGYTNAPADATLLLDTMRNTIKGKRGPSNHFWKFSFEATPVEKKGEVVWVQRWILPVQLS